MPVVVPVRHTHLRAQKQLDIYTFSRLKVDREVEGNKAQNHVWFTLDIDSE